MFITSGYSAQTRRVRSATEHRHRRPDVLVALRDLARLQRRQAGGGPLAAELLGIDAVQPDDVVLLGVGAVRVDRLAQALDGERAALVADGHGAAGVDRALD